MFTHHCYTCSPHECTCRYCFHLIVIWLTVHITGIIVPCYPRIPVICLFSRYCYWYYCYCYWYSHYWTWVLLLCDVWLPTSTVSCFPVIMLPCAVLVLDILCSLYLSSGIPVISTVTPASGGTCVELSATRSKVPHHTYPWWGPPLESSPPSGVGWRGCLQCSCYWYCYWPASVFLLYMVFPLYARSCWRPAHGVWN